jgi:Ger(x)C family germination protein
MVVILAMLTGCWNMKEIQNLSYVTAIGLDYRDGKHVVYAQLIDFSSVAKLEGQQKTREAPVWVGKGTGASFTEAVNRLYETAQQRMFWGHVTAIVFSESILKQNKYQDVLDLLNRYREIRYLVWVFSTKESIEEVFSTTPFFYESPKSSILHSPDDPYRQRSYIEPIRLFQFIMSLKEEARMSYMPSLRIDRTQWNVRREPHPLLAFSGMTVFWNNRYSGELGMDDLQGLPWMHRKTVRMPLTVERDQSLAAVLFLEKPKVRIKPSVQGHRVYFDVKLTIKAVINELHQDISEKDLTGLAEQKLEDQIRHTYLKGVEKKVDLYHLGEYLYRHQPGTWHRLEDDNHFVLHEDSLRALHLHVHLTSTGRYKLKPTENSATGH